MDMIRFYDQKLRQPHAPWNKGRLTGSKPPLQPKQVWAIRTRLQIADRKRDLALFNVAIDSKLRGCDVVRLRNEAADAYWPGRNDITAADLIDRAATVARP